MDWKFDFHSVLKYPALFSMLCACFALLVGCQHVERALSFQDAEDSYRLGDHQRAFLISEMLAYEGDAKSQYALGFMYFHGIGAPRDQNLGILWMQKAADNGNERAQIAIDSINSFRSLTPRYQPFQG